MKKKSVYILKDERGAIWGDWKIDSVYQSKKLAEEAREKKGYPGLYAIEKYVVEGEITVKSFGKAGMNKDKFCIDCAYCKLIGDEYICRRPIKNKMYLVTGLEYIENNTPCVTERDAYIVDERDVYCQWLGRHYKKKLE